MRNITALTSLLAVALFPSGSALGESSTDTPATVLHARYLFDGISGRVSDDATVIVQKGRIVGIGRSAAVPAGARVIELGDATLLPGLIDAHTHLIFSGSREDEFEQRIEGLSYLEIGERGGGILSTVEATRAIGFSP